MNEDIVSRSGSADNCEVEGEVPDAASAQPLCPAMAWIDTHTVEIDPRLPLLFTGLLLAVLQTTQ